MKNIMLYSPYHLFLLCLRRVYQKIHSNIVQLPKEENPDKVSELIRNKIMSEKPLMISRFGAVEISCVTNYLGITGTSRNPLDYIKGITPPWWSDEGMRFCMKNNAGFFPNDDDSLCKFSELMLKDMEEINILASWLPDEVRFIDKLSQADIISFITLDPFWSKIPWTKSLKWKKVLIIHPFADEIMYQYTNSRTSLHKNIDILPDFQLEVIKAVQSIGGNNSFPSWFDALEYMENEISIRQFDICLIGCGAYGMPLAAFIKRLGKQAIHMGGSLQLLFGIKGKRWETLQYARNYLNGKCHYPDLINEHWIRPFKESKFSGFEKVENGCYW